MTQDFWEYQANGDIKAGPISDNYIFSARNSAVRAYKAVEMEIIPGKIVSEIRQYFFRWVKGSSYSNFLVSQSYSSEFKLFYSSLVCILTLVIFSDV